jgi:hypothetical protein
MPSILNSDDGAVSGSAGLKYGSDGTGVLALQTNGTTAVTVNASQNVGIGATSIIAPLQIGVNANSSPAGNTGLTFRQASGSPTAGYGYSVRWDNANNTANDVGSIAYGFGVSAASAGYMRFSTADTERMRIDGSGNVTMTGTLTTSSRGIAKASVPAGTILQVVQSTTVSDATSNSNSYASTGFSVAITPSATSSKILLFCNFGWSSNTADFGFFAFGVNGTADANTLVTCFNQSAVGATNSMYFSSLSYIYSPASVSAQTYTLQFRCSGAPTQSLFFNNRSIGGSSGLCTLTAMEIAV